MNRSTRRWQTRFRSAVDIAEIESLQTDIMRFVAVIGFCLMAIFALIQSLPTVSSPWRDPVNSEEIGQLREALAVRQRELEQLRAENRRLATYRQDERMPPPDLVKPHSDPESVAESEPQTTAVLDAVPTPVPAAVEEGEPLSLVFESERALETLLQGGAVGLFLIAKDGGGKWKLDAETGTFERVGGARQVWFMDSSTVPRAYRKAAERLPGSDAHLWAVVLSDAIQRSLRQQIGDGDKETGKVVIQASGAVVYRP